MDQAQFMAWNARSVEENAWICQTLHVIHLTDSRAWGSIQRSIGCENAAELQGLARDKQDAVPGKTLKGSASIRQASCLSGISTDVIWRIGNG